MAVPEYRDFLYPLNVFMHVLTAEEGRVDSLHYGLFERPGQSIAEAQERSTRILVSRLPAPPARLLDVGTGLGTTLVRLVKAGYEVVGINPDASQIAAAVARHDASLDIRCVRFEDFSDGRFDAVVFQESSQYIDGELLFEKAAALTRNVIVLDEFAVHSLETEGALHPLPEFLAAARRHGFEKIEDVDLSAEAAPTIDYFIDRLPRYRAALLADLGITNAQVDALIAGGRSYRQFYDSGIYLYRLLRFRR